ncbi:MAG: hypothetical protein ICV51_08795 [Flavisolibacter sp.]|nr:hypothetical protein [Flavisolibacter sp.]
MAGFILLEKVKVFYHCPSISFSMYTFKEKTRISSGLEHCIRKIGCFLYLLLPLYSVAQAPVTNQRLFDTIPFIPEHGAQRLSQFAKEPVSTGGIIFLGNSITEGGDWKKLTGDSTAVNRGVGGDITFGVLARLDDIIKQQPSKLFILIGINDIGKDIPDAVIADNVRRIIQRIQQESPATKIYLQSILPVNPMVQNFPQHYDKQEHVIATNKLLKNVAAASGVTFINLVPLFQDRNKRLNANYTRDGLHLTKDAYTIWVQYLKNKKYL